MSMVIHVRHKFSFFCRFPDHANLKKSLKRVFFQSFACDVTG